MWELGNRNEAIGVFQKIIELDFGKEPSVQAQNAIDVLNKNQK